MPYYNFSLLKIVSLGTHTCNYLDHWIRNYIDFWTLNKITWRQTQRERCRPKSHSSQFPTMPSLPISNRHPLLDQASSTYHNPSSHHHQISLPIITISSFILNKIRPLQDLMISSNDPTIILPFDLEDRTNPLRQSHAMNNNQDTPIKNI